jgi:hypothetical protein
VDEREHLRLKLTHEVARLLKERSVRAALPALGDGEAPFIVGLPDDTMADLGRRVESLGGTAHLVVLTHIGTGTSRMRVLLFENSAHKELAELDDTCESAVDENTRLDMLMQAIEVGDVATFHIYDSETIVSFINDSVQPAVPA